MGNRKAFVEVFLAGLNAICPDNKNEQFYVPFFDGLNDEQFEAMVLAIEEGNIILPLMVPHLSDAKISVARNLDLGKTWGHEFFQHLWMTDPVNPSVVIKTPEKYLVIKLPLRRPSQTQESKMQAPKDAHSMDDTTGQVTGASKGSRISQPEMQLLFAKGLTSVIREYMKVRGGDLEAYRQLEQDIIETGEGSLVNAYKAGGEVVSKRNAATFLKAMHIGSTL